MPKKKKSTLNRKLRAASEKGEGAGDMEKDQAGEQLRLPALLGVISKDEQVCTQTADPEISDLFPTHRRSLSTHR